MSCILNRLLNSYYDVMLVITKSAFDSYLLSDVYRFDILTSGTNRIPSFDEMARSGVFHFGRAPLVSNDDSKRGGVGEW